MENNNSFNPVNQQYKVNYINDNFMTYDLDLHMYKLEPDAVADILQAQEEVIDEFTLQNLLRMIRNDFYAEAMDYTVYRDKFLHYLSDPDNRPYIKEAQRMMFQDLVINRSTPGMNFTDKDASLVTPRTRKYMKTMRLILIMDIHESPKWLKEKHLKGIVW